MTGYISGLILLGLSGWWLTIIGGGVGNMPKIGDRIFLVAVALLPLAAAVYLIFMYGPRP